ncbi:MAG: hypothetical protein AAGJ81_01730 [Verrucomicrobiota bacterium]
MIEHPYFKNHYLNDGKLWVDGEHRFLKTGKPLRNFADAFEVEQLIRDLGLIARKGFNNISLNCYWHHFNPSGNGTIEVSLEPLRELVAEIRAHGMFATLSVETYGVGGGQIPDGFWSDNPDEIAVNHEGKTVADTEYGYGAKVPSLFSSRYLASSRSYMRNLVRGLGAENFLYFETTVEPQFMGAQWLDYSSSAKSAYEEWIDRGRVTDAIPFPAEFPADETFRLSEKWNLFRAQTLADWINEDARALRAGAGNAPLWIASDYLDAESFTESQRCGDAVALLRGMSEIQIVQINWSWCNIDRKPNLRAYRRVRQVMEETGRDWAVTEHMTINGADYHESDMKGLLMNTIENGSHFGWEFVDIAADRDSPSTKPNDVLPGDFKPQHFAVYDENWEPKAPMKVVDEEWEVWMQMVQQSLHSEVSE